MGHRDPGKECVRESGRSGGHGLFTGGTPPEYSIRAGGAVAVSARPPLSGAVLQGGGGQVSAREDTGVRVTENRVTRVVPSSRSHSRSTLPVPAK